MKRRLRLYINSSPKNILLLIANFDQKKLVHWMSTAMLGVYFPLAIEVKGLWPSEEIFG